MIVSDSSCRRQLSVVVAKFILCIICSTRRDDQSLNTAEVLLRYGVCQTVSEKTSFDVYLSVDCPHGRSEDDVVQ